MTDNSVEASPQIYARVGGAMYLIIIALGIFGQVFVRDRIVVSGDSVATAANLGSMETLWRMGIAAEFISLICAIILAMVYFALLKPVHKELNLLSALFRMISIAVEAAAALYLVSALFPLGKSAALKAFSAEQLGALVGMAIRSHANGYSLALLFTGCTFLIHGYLVFKSGYLPRVLGILIQIAGVGYLANSFALILLPAIAGQVFLAIILPVIVAETSLSIWLLVKGVNLQKWNERIKLATVGAN